MRNDEGSDNKIVDSHGTKNWEHLLTSRACELALNIQKTGHSDNLDKDTDRTCENGFSNEVKWMETV